jgi:hypothetical protein
VEISTYPTTFEIRAIEQVEYVGIYIYIYSVAYNASKLCFNFAWAPLFFAKLIILSG